MNLLARIRRYRISIIVFGGALALAILGPIAVHSFRPKIGYRSALVNLLQPNVQPTPPDDVLRLDDIIKRKVDFVIDFGGFRYRGNTGNLIDACMYYYGAWEKSALNFMRDTLTNDSVMIDVGANTGIYSVVASKQAKYVHAIEPYPPILVRLHHIIDENKIPNVTVHPVGLGAEEAELPFFPPPDRNLGWASFVPGFVQGSRGDTLKLKIVQGDSYFQKNGIARVDFIKMDIEGYEKPALAGLQQTLRRNRPVVLMELSIDPSLPILFKSLQELRAAFPENYEFFKLQENVISGAYRLYPLAVSFDQKKQYNIVARPNEKASKVPLSAGARELTQLR